MKLDCFYLYNGKPVAIERLLTKSSPEGRQMAEVRHIMRKVKKEKETIFCDDLVELTHDRANALISEYNVRIHAINECLGYM